MPKKLFTGRGISNTTRLPQEIFGGIGLIIVEFARVEYFASQMISRVLTIDRQTARVVIKELSATDSIQIVVDLLEARKIKIETDFASLKNLLQLCQGRRNQVAHGVWAEFPNKPDTFIVSCLSRGTWTPATADKKIKRVLFPENVEFTFEYCKETVDTIRSAFDILVKMEMQIAEHIPWPEQLATPASRSHPLGPDGLGNSIRPEGSDK